MTDRDLLCINTLPLLRAAVLTLGPLRIRPASTVHYFHGLPVLGHVYCDDVNEAEPPQRRKPRGPCGEAPAPTQKGVAKADTLGGPCGEAPAPTREEIAERCAEIRRGWTEAETIERRRRVA